MINRTPAGEFSFSGNFDSIVGAETPAFIAYTEGELKPRIAEEAYSILHKIEVADFNGDNLDDVIVTYGDVYTKPRLYLSKGDGTFVFADWMPDGSERRLIRNVSIEDINNDGLLDYVGFTAPHGFYKDYLGSLWDFDEPNLILINTGDSFKLVNGLEESYHHGGDVGDLNHDGLLDIFGVSEFPSWHGTYSPRIPLIQSFSGDFQAANWGLDKIFSEEVISDVRIADLNRDGYSDLVLSISTQRQVSMGRVSTPEDSVGKGVVAYAFGDPKKNFSEVEWFSVGQHWMSRLEWERFVKIYDPTGLGANRYNAGPSVIEVVDVNNDGLLDILVGFYVSAGATNWRTSGFIYLENSGKGFIDRTSTVFPQQSANRDLEKLTSFTLGFDLIDLDGDGDRDLVLSTFMGERADESSQSQALSSIIFIQQDGIFTPPPRGQLAPRFERSIELQHVTSGDFNGDGAPDLLSTIRSGDSHVFITHLNKLSSFDSAKELRGSPGNDLIDLSKGNFTFARGGAGNDFLVGHIDRLDAAIYWNDRNVYSVFKVDGVWKVQDLAGNEGTDSLKHIERLIFSDRIVALDTEAVGGQAYRVYKAAFNREPDQGGLGYWIAQMDSGMNMVEVAARFIDSSEFRAMYGTSPTDEQYLTKVYQNVLGRDPEPDGYNWWLNEMRTNPEKTRAKVLADFSESAENKAGTAQLVGQGIVYEHWVG